METGKQIGVFFFTAVKQYKVSSRKRCSVTVLTMEPIVLEIIHFRHETTQ